jgi:hypothetical protein
MVRPAALTSRPSLVIALLGGAAAVLLLSALLFLGPVLGLPFVDVPHLVGGVFAESAAAAFWLGFAILFLGGWIVLPVLFVTFWPLLPGGNEVGLAHGAVKGLLWGAVAWAVSGLLFPVLGWLNQLEGLENPGFFALGVGALGAAGVLLGHLAYGAALGLVSGMGQGISPVEVMGWYQYGKSGMNRAAASGNR